MLSVQGERLAGLSSLYSLLLLTARSTESAYARYQQNDDGLDDIENEMGEDFGFGACATHTSLFPTPTQGRIRTFLLHLRASISSCG